MSSAMNNHILAFICLALTVAGRRLAASSELHDVNGQKELADRRALSQILAQLLLAPSQSAAFATRTAEGASFSSGRPTTAKKDAVVVGAGPAGLATAWVLAERGFDVTVLERRSEPSPYEPQRAYLYLIDGHGQQFTDAAKITEELASPELSVSSTNYTVTRCFPHGTRVESVPPILEPKKDGKSSYWIPRQAFLALLCRLLAGNDRVRILYGTELRDVTRTTDGGTEVVVQVDSIKKSDPLRLRPSLLVGADGLNSIVRERMAEWSAADPSLGAKADEFTQVVLPSPSGGLNYKMLRFPALFPLDVYNASVTAQPRKAYSIRPCKKAPLGQTRLGMLPVADETYPRTANVILPPHHPVWSLKSSEDVLDWLRATFPQLPVDDIVSEEEAKAFVSGRPGTFPAPCFTPRQHLLLPSAAVCIVGDAVHAFPPDIGQGVNSALLDAMHLAHALDDAKIGSSAANSDAGDNLAELRRAMPAYGQSAAKEAKAIARLAQVGFPYQYGQLARDGVLPRLREKLWFANFILRTFVLSKLAPRIFSPAAIVLVQRPNLSYSQVWKMASATTRRLVIATCGLAALMFALARKAAM